MKVYVASSWRNEARQQMVVRALRHAGHEAYDFRRPAPEGTPGAAGFSWTEIDGGHETWSPAQFREALNHQVAERGFGFDMNALRECDVCVLVMPCGRSAHLELGWAAGAGKRTYVLLDETVGEPELMLKAGVALGD
jgi:hypothetical protein